MRLPKANFGKIQEKGVNLQDDDQDPDDEELEKTPEDVVRMLGFDPKDMKDDD